MPDLALPNKSQVHGAPPRPFKEYTTIMSTISMYIYLWSLLSAGRSIQRVEVASCFHCNFPETKKLNACEFHNQAQIVAIQWGNPQTRFDVMTDYNHPKSSHRMLFEICSLNLTVRFCFWTAKLPQHHMHRFLFWFRTKTHKWHILSPPYWATIYFPTFHSLDPNPSDSQ